MEHQCASVRVSGVFPSLVARFCTGFWLPSSGMMASLAESWAFSRLFGAVIGAVSAVAYAAVLGGSAFSQPLVMWGGVVVFGVVGAIASGVLTMRLKQERLLAR